MNESQDQVFSALIRSLEDPNELWAQGQYTLSNASRGLAVWTGNIPVLDCNLRHPAPLRLSLKQKWVLYKAVALARSHEVRRRLNREAAP